MEIFISSITVVIQLLSFTNIRMYFLQFDIDYCIAKLFPFSFDIFAGFWNQSDFSCFAIFFCTLVVFSPMYLHLSHFALHSHCLFCLWMSVFHQCYITVWYPILIYVSLEKFWFSIFCVWVLQDIVGSLFCQDLFCFLVTVCPFVATLGFVISSWYFAEIFGVSFWCLIFTLYSHCLSLWSFLNLCQSYCLYPIICCNTETVESRSSSHEFRRIWNSCEFHILHMNFNLKIQSLSKMCQWSQALAL